MDNGDAYSLDLFADPPPVVECSPQPEPAPALASDNPEAISQDSAALTPPELILTVDQARERECSPAPDLGQLVLIDLEEPWRAEWKGMPEFSIEDLTPRRSITVHFESDGDVAKFSALVGQTLGENLKSIWFPEAEIGRYADKRYANE